MTGSVSSPRNVKFLSHMRWSLVESCVNSFGISRTFIFLEPRKQSLQSNIISYTVGLISESFSLWLEIPKKCKKRGNTVFPHTVYAETILFWKWKMWTFLYSFYIMAIFYFINWIVAAETIKGGETYSREETICGNTVC